MTTALALLAACAFALGSVLQQKGTLQTAAAEGDARFLMQIWRRPMWLAGGLAQATGWVLQAAALDRGSLLVVQSLCSLSLVIALPLGVWLTAQVVTSREWLGAGGVTLGIVLLLSGGSPESGSSVPDAAAWWLAGILGAGSVAVLGSYARRTSGAVRALLFGSAAGVCFALQAAVTKAFVPLVGEGLAAVVSSWTVYALILTALAGFVFQQSALKTGALAPAVASSNAITLFGSIVFGISVFGETVSGGGGRLAPCLIGVALTAAGIGLLARSASPLPSRDMSSRGGSEH